MARKKSIITDLQAKYVEGVLDGKTNTAAARGAGYAQPTMAGYIASRSENVRSALATARSELSSAAQIKRADLVEILMGAIDMARIMGDPMGIIAGAREVGKMLGLYAPEEKKIDLTVNQARLRSQYESMSDEELLGYIEGESRRVVNTDETEGANEKD